MEVRRPTSRGGALGGEEKAVSETEKGRLEDDECAALGARGAGDVKEGVTNGAKGAGRPRKHPQSPLYAAIRESSAVK